MGNMHIEEEFGGVGPDAHSVVVAVNFKGCRCDPELLTGAKRGVLLDMLRVACEEAGFGVIGEALQPFGRTAAQRNKHGVTFNFILEDSGVSFDIYPEKRRVQMNLHYCNIRNNNDPKVPVCVDNLSAVFMPTKVLMYEPIVMPIGDDDETD